MSDPSKTRPALSADRLSHHFAARGGGGEHCRLYSNLESSVRWFLETKWQRQESETPVLGCYFDTETWTLLTDHRLLAVDDGQPLQLDLASLESVDLEPSQLVLGKSGFHILRLDCKDGRRVYLRLEPGPPYFGVWNVLRLLARRGSS